ncbi:MAG: hypothetical protein WD875_15160 [Pirellulales bacterium]
MFHPKHHVGGLRTIAQWARGISRNEEFGIFDTADRLEVADEAGNLFGVLRGENGRICTLGAWDEQIAFFPCTPANEAWHGYPLFPVNKGLSKSKPPPSRPVPLAVFRRMTVAGLLKEDETKRLARGRHL